MLFLSGDRGTLSKLLEAAARLKAVLLIIDQMRAEKLSESDPQYKTARDHEERTQMHLVASARECFTRLTYPTKEGLQTCDFLMEFKGNEYNGEKQIRDALAAKQKFTTEVDGETFRKKIEQRLFTRQQMPWTEVL